MIHFDRIEVVNQLRKEHVLDIVRNYTADYDKLWIFDRVHHEINQFCSSHSLQEVYIDKFDQLDEALVGSLSEAISLWAPGLEIQSIRVTKPRIPDAIARNYEKVEAERAEYDLEVTKQHVARKNAMNERERAKVEAQKLLDVSLIDCERRVREMEATVVTQKIADEMYLAREKSHADSQFYVDSKQAEANNQKLTPELIRLRMFQALMNNTQVTFGDKVPNIEIKK
eukprot:TRINITY_DN12391_c0_g1_i2.p1 TRINITY_DN12391_c0_g1~~TRINITY_DN12391_c0_g1_i2.p1  ORF type:complete len:227 (-),score=54.91 TRINITY_DN12391_c0_g1_i2:123-803(-)